MEASERNHRTSKEVRIAETADSTMQAKQQATKYFHGKGCRQRDQSKSINYLLLALNVAIIRAVNAQNQMLAVDPDFSMRQQYLPDSQIYGPFQIPLAFPVLMPFQSPPQTQTQPQNSTSLRNPLIIQRRQVSDLAATKLEAPPSMQQHGLIQGPGVDLVAFNRRRFELEHQHPYQGSTSTDLELRRGEFIEANLAAIPDKILAQLPEGTNREVMDTLSAEPALIVASQSAGSLFGADRERPMREDSETASIERLTKSCLTVHASSASPDQLNVTFHLYTKNNPLQPFLIRPQITRHELIKSSPFDPAKPIKWITHGFHTNVDKSEWMLETKDKILAFEDANVILTDWRRGASPALAFYPKAAANAHIVAKMIVNILRRLKNDIHFGRIHLIGHSLGAHIMGFVGSAFTEEYLHQQQQLLASKADKSTGGGPLWSHESLKSDSSALIGRITACDPALPCFGPSSSAPNSRPTTVQAVVPVSTAPSGQSGPTLEVRRQGAQVGGGANMLLSDIADWTPTMWTHLRPDSAVVVEVMHSNPGVMGYADPLGDFDFYPNGHERQPGCGNEGAADSGGPSTSTSTTDNYKATLGPSQPPSPLAPPAHQLYNPQFRSARYGGRLRRQAIKELTGSIIKSVTSPTNRRGAGSRITSTLSKFIKPIRDFVNGYTCSHHRSVEYMVESMYYEQVPQDRKLDRDLVCQMVGYLCSDYSSFKRGFCFRCRNELDCRAFLMSANPTPPAPDSSYLSTLAQHHGSTARSLSVGIPLPNGYGLEKFKRLSGLLEANASSQTDQSDSLSSMSRWVYTLRGGKTASNSSSSSSNDKSFKRVLPSLNHYNQNYRPLKRNQYYFDTRPTRDFCLHHYHIFVKYRWFRVREGVNVDGFMLSGTLANISQESPATFHRHTHHSYTLLLTNPIFLGQIESLMLIGEKLKPTLVEYIEVTYMSNLDPRIRSLGSARLCRSQTSPATGPTSDSAAPPTNQKPPTNVLFVRCSGLMV